MNRRGFLLGAGASLIAAPAIVRAASLMPVRGIVMPDRRLIGYFRDVPIYEQPLFFFVPEPLWRHIKPDDWPGITVVRSAPIPLTAP